MKKIVGIYFLFIFLGGAKSTTPDSPPIKPTPKESMTYLALGDSYTIGESVVEDMRWPVQLSAKLNEAGVKAEIPKIIARTGWTTNELIQAIENEQLTDTFDLVSLLIGVNNQYRGYPFEQYEKEFVELIDITLDFAGQDTQRVFVVSIPDYGVTPFGQSGNPDKIAQELDAYNAKAKEICEQYNIPFFDITPISREAINDPELVASDNLHPSAKMYTQWVELFFDEVKALVE